MPGDLSRFPTWVPGSQTLEPSSAGIPGHWQGAGSEVEKTRLEPVPKGDDGATGESFTC